MDLTHVAVRLFNSNSPDTYEAEFLVDTGAMDTMAPAFELKVELVFMGEVVPVRIVFGPDNSEPLLGVIALETAGFIVDPKNQTLRKLPARPLKRVA